MGWLPWSSSAPADTRPTSIDGYKAPDRNARALCWEARDSFFECLEKNGIVDSVKNHEKAEKACSPQLRQFEQDCASSWVTYFKKRRIMEYQRDQTIKRLAAEGADVGELPAGKNAGFGGIAPSR
ncbi:Cytochrome c oxidase subunit 6B new16-like protein [Elsinoe fawcettii]|nr:Cytochrome c oxidase subunit 6B new16-like protein [Elsinoe fawcettii]